MAEDMSDDRFWSLIDYTLPYAGNQDGQSEALRGVLGKLTPEDIAAFTTAFQRQQLRTYSWDLWGAAYVIHGGASDDGFEYFQRWLISRGRRTFEAAAADPDALAELIPPGTINACEFEGFAYIAPEVWQEKTGINPWKDMSAGYPYTGASPADEPSGIPFKEDINDLKARYPKLWARFGEAPLM